MPSAIRAILEYCEEESIDLHHGDTLLCNDPFITGSHPWDIMAVSPVINTGELIAFVGNLAHHADIGGMSPGSLPLSTEIYQEGIIIPPIKLINHGIQSREILTLITANSRAPQEREGDLKAQMAAQHVGENRLLDVIQKHGLNRVQEHATKLMHTSRKMTEKLISKIPPGIYEFEDYLEDYPPSPNLIKIKARITIRDSSMRVDFRESSPQVATNFNAVRAVVNSATWYCVRLLSEEDTPMN
jgi:N-methylhydantoinase B